MRTSLLAGKIRLKHPARRRQRHLRKFFVWRVLVYPMASFKEIRESLVMGYTEDIVDDDEFLLFYDFYGSKNPNFPYASYPPFDP